jgi:protoporphyrinogen oxidase
VLAAIERTESNWPGLHLAGSYRGGVAIPDRIALGRRVAARIDPLVPRSMAY